MFENDRMSRDRLTSDLDVFSLCEFNSVNIQCLLPRIDQNLLHAPESISKEMNESNLTHSTQKDTQKQQISFDVIKTLSHQLIKEEEVKVKEVIASVIG